MTLSIITFSITLFSLVRINVKTFSIILRIIAHSIMPPIIMRFSK
jgi:hypothetical protein